MNTKPRKYRKLPVVIEAMEFTTPKSGLKAATWAGHAATFTTNNRIRIGTREGELYAYPGDFIIKGVEGEFYPCGGDIFRKTYEEVPS